MMTPAQRNRLIIGTVLVAASIVIAVNMYHSMTPPTHADHDHAIASFDAGGFLWIRHVDGEKRNLVGRPGKVLVLHWFDPTAANTGEQQRAARFAAQHSRRRIGRHPLRRPLTVRRRALRVGRRGRHRPRRPLLRQGRPHRRPVRRAPLAGNHRLRPQRSARFPGQGRCPVDRFGPGRRDPSSEARSRRDPLKDFLSQRSDHGEANLLLRTCLCDRKSLWGWSGLTSIVSRNQSRPEDKCT